MNITDLAETDVNFEVLKDSKYWDFTFYAKVHDDYEYMQSLNRSDIERLRINCKKILKATHNLL
jgi:hypothetical protein